MNKKSTNFSPMRTTVHHGLFENCLWTTNCAYVKVFGNLLSACDFLSDLSMQSLYNL